jgi:hypothetical protein
MSNKKTNPCENCSIAGAMAVFHCGICHNFLCQECLDTCERISFDDDAPNVVLPLCAPCLKQYEIQRAEKYVTNMENDVKMDEQQLRTNFNEIDRLEKEIEKLEKERLWLQGRHDVDRWWLAKARKELADLIKRNENL